MKWKLTIVFDSLKKCLVHGTLHERFSFFNLNCSLKHSENIRSYFSDYHQSSPNISAKEMAKPWKWFSWQRTCKHYFAFASKITCKDTVSTPVFLESMHLNVHVSDSTFRVNQKWLRRAIWVQIKYGQGQIVGMNHAYSCRPLITISNPKDFASFCLKKVWSHVADLPQNML